VDRKGVAILALIVALIAMGIGWLSSGSKPHENIPYDNTYEWTEIFHGYEAYLDRRISYSVISGTSMEPTFWDGDTILWVEVNPQELKVGDIIIYEHPTHPSRELITHRIVGVIKNGEYRFETKGDNRSESDAKTPISAYFVSEDDLKGLVICVIYAAK